MTSLDCRQLYDCGKFFPFGIELLEGACYSRAGRHALSLEGLNGNVSPLLEDIAAFRLFPSHLNSTAELRSLLEGSYLSQADDERILQDPLSFRTAPYLSGQLRRQPVARQGACGDPDQLFGRQSGIAVSVEPNQISFRRGGLRKRRASADNRRREYLHYRTPAFNHPDRCRRRSEIGSA
ncbi:aromatic amino acid lyase [Pseudaminobacter sp. NGMCC 1.201702]|uniref:aromatic amino acid lyase n=1 Tax=Pseudaminobacter sp. NGMCC 1.201702 TaxID=3391825 RepID=UPI0039F01EBF